MSNIIKEITEDLNKLVNKRTFVKNKWRDFEINALISNYIGDFYHDKIYDWKINSNYPDVEIIIQQYKYKTEFDIIKLTRFERLQKLIKLKEISE